MACYFLAAKEGRGKYKDIRWLSCTRVSCPDRPVSMPQREILAEIRGQKSQKLSKAHIPAEILSNRLRELIEIILYFE